jgi:hypothetical protein
MKQAMFRTISIAALAACAIPAFAQDDPVIDPSTLSILTATPSAVAATHFNAGTASLVVTPALPLWQYSVVSPRDGNTYTGSMVGGNPFNRGARTTNMNVVLIPVRIQLTGTVRNFDPTSPDASCLGPPVPTALARLQGSPLFNFVPNLTMNGVNLGTTTFPDAFQRASFWSNVSTVAPAYHSDYTVTTAATQTITTVNNANGSGASFSFGNECGTNATSADNPPRYAAMDINFIDAQLNIIIANLGLNANQFPFFVLYRTFMTNGPPGGLSGNCCILGYHSTVSNTPTPALPGQTYGIGMYDLGKLFTGSNDISGLSHEFMEWTNDPSGNNLVPEWGNIGQVGGCVVSGNTHSQGQNNLEVGDPLSGTLFPAITMLNGVTYHPQEMAFYSWFIGGPSLGAGGKYSSNGTFTGFAKPCATGGGTN